MTIKSILVPMPSGKQVASTALEAAISAAHTFGAHIEGVYLSDAAADMPMMDADGALAIDVIAAARAADDEGAVQAEEIFRNFIQDYGIPYQEWPAAKDGASAGWRSVRGDVHAQMAHLGCVFDLVVVARPDRTNSVNGRLVETALFDSHRPVLIAPPALPEKLAETTLDGRRIIIGWNQTAQSALAGADALPLLERAQAVQIFSIITGAKSGVSASEFALYLRRHGIESEVKMVEPDSRSVGQAVLAAAMEFNANLLVMGAYSHSRLRELILGGVTSHILENAGIPVFMSH